MPPADMDCKELVEVMTDYLEGALPAPDHERFERHLSMCDGCATHLDQMRTTIRMTGMLTEDDVPTEARDGLLRVFRAWKQG